MRNVRVGIVVGMMALALAGLVIIQVYWISKAIHVNREIFARHVNDALQNVAVKLERKDAFAFVSSRTLKDTSILPDVGLKTLTAGTLRPYLMNDLRRMKQIGNPVTDVPESFTDQFTPSPEAANDSLQLLSFEEDIIPAGLLTNNHIRTREELNKVLKKKYLLQKLAVDLVLRNSPIEQRIDFGQLDTMLHKELTNQNITLPYEFGVYQERRKNLVFASAGSKTDRFKAAAYKAQLFPNDFFLEPNFLEVYFPGQNAYLLRQITFILASSVAFILIIFFTFLWMIRSFLAQKKLSEMKTDFINNMTHEFKTPITTIALASEALKDPEVMRNGQRLGRLSGVIADENKRLEKQVERVLEMARMDRGEIKIAAEPVDMHEVLQEAVAHINLMLEERRGKVEVKAEAPRAGLLADRVHLANIVHNLLDNAIKYSPESPDISIKTSNYKGGLRVEVTDKGVGMTPEAQKRIFEKFYRVPTGNVHDVKGFGLGLSYVKTMLEAHHGTIEVRSAPGKGSTFTIYLPQHETDKST